MTYYVVSLVNNDGYYTVLDVFICATLNRRKKRASSFSLWVSYSVFIYIKNKKSREPREKNVTLKL
jgi:hypothetical protein